MKKKHDYRKRFSVTRDVSRWSRRLGWATHKAFWQDYWPESSMFWVSQRHNEVR